jgi:hypothetical protein
MHKVFDQILEKADLRDCYLVQIINYIIKIIQRDKFSEQILMNASQIGALILHSNNFNLMQLVVTIKKDIEYT